MQDRGEISNCIFLGHSNKAHDGFLGHSIIGEWCNIGAGTSSSNLKNDYGEVKMWNYRQNKFVNTQMQFLGMFMGDHSKCSINSSFNTGTTIGVCCNLFGPGFYIETTFHHFHGEVIMVLRHINLKKP